MVSLRPPPDGPARPSQPPSPFGRPRAPLQGWTPQVVDPRFGFAWYCGRGLIVTQAAVTHGTVAAAHANHDLADRVLAHCTEDIADAGGLYVIHDMRLLESYDSEARQAWAERMRQRGKGYLRGSTVVVRAPSTLLRMAVAGINLMASLNLGARVELQTDLVAALKAENVRAPDPSSQFP